MRTTTAKKKSTVFWLRIFLAIIFAAALLFNFGRESKMIIFHYTSQKTSDLVSAPKMEKERKRKKERRERKKEEREGERKKEAKKSFGCFLFFFSPSSSLAALAWMMALSQNCAIIILRRRKKNKSLLFEFVQTRNVCLANDLES